MKKLRWGIIGAAKIARKNWKAIFHSGNGSITAVGARDAARAEAFVEECQAECPFRPAPAAFGTYEELLASGVVDAVYIPLPTGLRKEWVIRAARAGKHVLCEKPCAVDAGDLREMIRACRDHGVQFMDGVMFMHNPRMAALRAVLDNEQRIGPIRRIMSAFSFAGEEESFSQNIRVNRTLEPAGCLGDLGWYCLRFSLFALRWKLPSAATGRILVRAADGTTPTEFSGELIHDDGASASFYCSFRTGFQQWATVSGARGCLRVADFVHPQNGYEPAYEVNGTGHRVLAAPETAIPQDAASLSLFGHPTAQDTRMFRNFAAQVASGKLDDVWPELALKTQLVMDACLTSARADGRLIPLSSA